MAALFDVYGWLQQVDWPGNPPGAPMPPFQNFLDVFRGDRDVSIGGGEGLYAIGFQAVSYQFAESAIELDMEVDYSGVSTSPIVQFAPNEPYDYSRITLVKLDAAAAAGALSAGERRFGRR